MFLPKAIKAKAVVLSAAVFSMSVLLVWFFPKFWFARSDPEQGYFWLSEQTNVAGWRYTHQPVSRTAEAFLVADHLVSGEFTKEDGTRVRVFSAKRYSPTPRTDAGRRSDGNSNRPHPTSPRCRCTGST
ncbi:MAG: hypothetical protein DME18_15035 [Verrucomicrobia bacterium]|nr:MAG: hypothetical protein DME18_15035 [Verrucomicrobiota bacterium]